jgi:hypothetical protein
VASPPVTSATRASPPTATRSSDTGDAFSTDDGMFASLDIARLILNCKTVLGV